MSQDSMGLNQEAKLRQRRRYFLKNLLLPAMVSLVVILLVVLTRDMIYKQEYIKGMQQLARKIQDFNLQHNRLPSLEEVGTFELGSRVRVIPMDYEPSHIYDDSPGETILTYYPSEDFQFFLHGHAAIYLNGQVEWLDWQELDQKLKKREKAHKAKMVQGHL